MTRFCATLFVSLVMAGVQLTYASDLPVTYNVQDKPLKTAISGTQLTFTLYSDSTCAQQVYQATVAVENVTLISKLKLATPKGATKKPTTDQIQATLSGVTAGGNLYLNVTGTGVTASGPACQAQAAQATAELQTLSTVFSSGSLTAPASFTVVPSLSMTLAVPASSALYISTDGGAAANGGLAVLDVAVYIDGIPTGVLRRATCGDPPTDAYCAWSMAMTITLLPGTHTVSVRAIQAGGGGTLSVGGGAGSQTQGQLSVLIIKV